MYRLYIYIYIYHGDQLNNLYSYAYIKSLLKFTFKPFEMKYNSINKVNGYNSTFVFFRYGNTFLQNEKKIFSWVKLKFRNSYLSNKGLKLK